MTPLLTAHPADIATRVSCGFVGLLKWAWRILRYDVHGEGDFLYAPG
jgi:hypothetical protein